jgi:hypothetical protein
MGIEAAEESPPEPATLTGTTWQTAQGGRGAGVHLTTAPYFFFSYAHTPERPWIEKLFRDLSAEVLERTTLPVTAEVGFMDSGLSSGAAPRAEVAGCDRELQGLRAPLFAAIFCERGVRN